MHRPFYILFTALFCLQSSVVAQDEQTAIPTPLKVLVEHLNSSDSMVREKAVNALQIQFYKFTPDNFSSWPNKKRFSQRAAIREKAKPLVSHWLRFLNSEDKNVRGAAEIVLTVLSTEAKEAVPELERDALDDEAPLTQRLRMIYILLHITPEDRPVGPLFLKFLESQIAQGALDVDNEDSLQDSKQQVMSAANMQATGVALQVPAFAGTLAMSGHAKVEVPYLLQIATGDYPTAVRAVAVGTLGELEFEATSATKTLRKLLRDDKQLVQSYAAKALLTIEKDAGLIPEIIDALNLVGAKRKEFEESAREGLEREKHERERMAELFDDGDVKFFIHLLAYGNGVYRRQAIRNLTWIGHNARAAVPELRKALKDPDEETRRLAADALVAIEKSTAKSNDKAGTPLPK